MKILVCGKGGSGKSTIVALLAREMALRKNRVLVIDSDESNIGLHNRLGMEKPDDFMNYFGGKKLLFERTKEMKKEWGLDDLRTDYLTEKGNIRLLPWERSTSSAKDAPVQSMSSPRNSWKL